MNSEQNGFTIGLCTAGKRELRISGRSWEIVPGCLFILIPQQFTEDISCSKDFSARTLSASLEAILEHPSPVDINILNITFLHPVIQLLEDRAARLLGYYDFIEKRNNDTGNAYHEEISKTLTPITKRYPRHSSMHSCWRSATSTAVFPETGAR